MLVFLSIAVFSAIFITNLRINWLNEDMLSLRKSFRELSADHQKDFELYVAAHEAFNRRINEMELSLEPPALKPAPKARKKNVQAK